MKTSLLSLFAIVTVSLASAQSAINNKTLVITPDICLVTVDDSSKHNIIIWDKTLYAHVDSFIVYRQVATTYLRVGAQAYNKLSLLLDTAKSVGGPNGGDPNLGNYKYKLQIRDSSGAYSSLSPYHRTIFITTSGGGQFSWTAPYLIEGQAADTNYVLSCDTANNNIWSAVASSSSGGQQTTLSDPGFSHHSAVANWRVDALGFNCNPTLRLSNGDNTTFAARVKSHSNQSNNRVSGIKQNDKNNTLVNIYPNPTSNTLNINFSKISVNKVTIKIISLFGNEVYNSIHAISTGTTLPIETSNLTPGIYLMQIITDNNVDTQRFIKE